MSKNYFNDPLPHKVTFRLECSGCRATINMRIAYYPHAPRNITTCPVCQECTDGIKVVAITPET